MSRLLDNCKLQLKTGSLIDVNDLAIISWTVCKNILKAKKAPSNLTYGKKPHDELVQYVENQNTLNIRNTFYVGMIEAKMLVVLDTCGLKDIPALL